MDIREAEIPNLDGLGKQGSFSRDKSRKSKGSGARRDGSTGADGNTSRGGSEPHRRKGNSSSAKAMNKGGEDGGKWRKGSADVPLAGEEAGPQESMTNGPNSGLGTTFPDQSSGSEYARTAEIEEDENNDKAQQRHWSGNSKIEVAGILRFVKQSFEWVRQQEPAWLAVKAAALQAKAYVVPMVEYTWPIVSTCLLQFGSLVLVLFVLWLDCCIRGIGSFIRLGSTAAFTLLWCSFLNTIAIAGFLYVLLTMGIACIAAIVLGYTVAMLIMASFGALMLWMYGSFWITGAFIIIGGILFALNHAHLALLITATYSIYCAKVHVGWLGLVLCMNMAFISSDILIYFIKGNVNENKGRSFDEQTGSSKSRGRNFSNESGQNSSYGGGARSPPGRSVGESSQTSQFGEASAGPSTSAQAEAGPNSADEEVMRLLDSPDYYAALGFPRFKDIDFAVLKREYRKKAMLVHPDKNMGNSKAEEAFKKLQNAYEALVDSAKKKIYDDELRRDDLIKSFRMFQSGAQKNGRYDSSEYGFIISEDEVEDLHTDSRRIACRKCNGSHIWIHTERAKTRARWCQDCQDYHQAKDGDGWVEQSGHSFFFGMLQKVDVPHAYACADSKIFDVTEWVACQGMKCTPNSHKPTFHVNTTITGKNAVRGGSRMHKNGANGGMATNLNENMTEEEFFKWLENAMASGVFDHGNGGQDNAGVRTGNRAKSNKKKKKGRKQW